MRTEFELCFGMDTRGRLQAARVPAGLAEPGMMLRLVGGIFLMVTEVLPWTGTEGIPVPRAAEVLKPVWRDCHAG